MAGPVIALPGAGDDARFLRGDGAWATPPAGASADYTDAAVAALAADVPSLSHLRLHTMMFGAIASSRAFPLFIADLPCTIVNVSFTNFSSDVAKDDTNYWNFTLARYRDGVASTIATINTRQSGIAINRRTGYSFSGIAFDPTYSVFSPGDVLSVALNANGAPTALNTMGFTTAWQPT